MKEFDHFETTVQCEEVFHEEPSCVDNLPGEWPGDDVLRVIDGEPEPREDHFRDAVDADADALASAGFGVDEDYCHDTPIGEDYGNGFDND